jgi:hypothetical protein
MATPLRYNDAFRIIFQYETKVLPTSPLARPVRGQCSRRDASAVRDHVLATHPTTTLKHAINSVYCHNNLSDTCADLAHGLRCGRDLSAGFDEHNCFALRAPQPIVRRTVTHPQTAACACPARGMTTLSWRRDTFCAGCY